MCRLAPQSLSFEEVVMNVSSFPMGFAACEHRAIAPLCVDKIARIFESTLHVYEADDIGRKVLGGWSMDADLSSEIGTEGPVKLQLFQNAGALQIGGAQLLIDYAQKQVVRLGGATNVPTEVSRWFRHRVHELSTPGDIVSVPQEEIIAVLRGTTLYFCDDHEAFDPAELEGLVGYSLADHLERDVRREIVVSPSGRFVAVASGSRILLVDQSGKIYPALRERNADLRSLWFSADETLVHGADVNFDHWFRKELPRELCN